MKFAISLSLLLLLSCSSRYVKLKNPRFVFEDLVQITVSDIREFKNDARISLQGFSTDKELVGFKPEDITCGKGTAKNLPTVVAAKGAEVIVFRKIVISEFQVVCATPEIAKLPGNYSVTFKNLYSTQDGKPGRVLKSNVTLIFK